MGTTTKERMNAALKLLSGAKTRMVAVIGGDIRLSLRELFAGVGREVGDPDEALPIAVAVAYMLYESEPSGFRPKEFPSNASIRTAQYVLTSPEKFENVKPLGGKAEKAMKALVKEAREWNPPAAD